MGRLIDWPRPDALHVLFESDGVVALRLARGKNEGDLPSSDALEDGLQRLWPCAQLLEVSALELRPLARIVAEPAPQFGGGGSLLGPKIDPGVLLREAARPQSFDKNAAAIGS